MLSETHNTACDSGMESNRVIMFAIHKRIVIKKM